MPPQGLEQPPNSSEDTGVRLQSGAISCALQDETTAGTAAAGHQGEAEGTAASDQGNPLDKLAAALLALSPAERATAGRHAHQGQAIGNRRREEEN